MSNTPGIQWREWGSEAFAEAKAQDRPILLDIGAVWCHWCHVMDDGIPGDPVHTGTYTNADVQRRIAEHFIPIKVDNDRRPDINARYNMGGWPTTAFLTPEGETLYGETYVTPTRMIGLLDYIADLYQNRKDEIAEQASEMRERRAQAEKPPAPSDLDMATVSRVIESIKQNFDPAYGGFGSQPKFPHPAALTLALEQYAQTHDPELRAVCELTLHGMADGGMYDQYAGGFFRYSTTRDWSIPHYEKMLEDNAKLIPVYALAYQLFGDTYYLDVLKSASDWLLCEMRDPETGAFAGSQDADKEEAYYGQPLSVRATLPTPYIDRTVYAGWNALMVSALVARYKITGELDILDAATKAFAFVDGMTNDEGELFNYSVLYHFFTKGKAQGTFGLLNDQTAFIQAASDLYEVTGREWYSLIAREASEFVIDHLHDKNEVGFSDMPFDEKAIGELARPKKDMTENAEAAVALLRHSAFNASRTKWREYAVNALKLFVAEYPRQSYFAAAYARAVDAVIMPQLHIVIVGEDTPARRELQQAAWQFVSPGKAVETLSIQDGAGWNYPAAEDGAARAYLCLGTTCFAPVSTGEELRQLWSAQSSRQV